MLLHSWAGVWLILIFLFPLVSHANEEGEEELCARLTEHLSLSAKITMTTMEVGSLHRFIQVDCEKNRMNAELKIDVDVSAIVVHYHRHAHVKAEFDKDGLVSFETKINLNGKQTDLKGERKLIAGRTKMHISGKVEDILFIRYWPFEAFDITNIEQYGHAAALTRKKSVWQVLNLFNGKIEETTVTPMGKGECPKNEQESCLKTQIQTTARKGHFYFRPDSILHFAEGEDEEGQFIFKPMAESKKTEETTQKEKHGKGWFRSLL